MILLAGGQFAIVSSAAGKAGVPFSGSYTGSKHAINVSDEYLGKDKKYISNSNNLKVCKYSWIGK